MTEETVAETAAGDVNQTETTAETTNQATETQAQETTQTEQQTQQAEPQEDWRDKEIRRKHAKLKEMERETERIKKERDDALALAQARIDSSETATEQPAPRTTQQPAVTEAEIERRANLKYQQDKYQEQLTATNATGEKDYGDKWGKALDKLSTFGQVDPADMTAILNTDNPAKVLFELGSNPAEYQRLMDLPPAKRLTEIVKISMKQEVKPTTQISRAPPPTESVGNRVAADTDLRSEKVSDEAWYAKRQAEKRERFEQQRALGRR